MHANNPRILTYRDLLSSQDIHLDSFLNNLNQQPIHKRRKLLNINTRSKIKLYPNFIYKYLPLAEDKHKKFLRDYLVESKLWLSSPNSFNDPFDMKCRYIFEGKPHEKRKHLNTIFKLYDPDLPKNKRERIISHSLTNDQFLVETLENINKNQINENGVCCFSEDTKNILMWAHYGSSHKGISLQFQICKDISIFTQASAVTYSHEYPTINYLNDNLSNAIAGTMWRKSKNWEYEKERRIIHPIESNCYLQFNPSALTALILRCKLESDSEEIIKSLLRERKQKNYPPLRIFRAIQDNKEYKIRIKRISNFS